VLPNPARRSRHISSLRQYKTDTSSKTIRGARTLSACHDAYSGGSRYFVKQDSVGLRARAPRGPGQLKKGPQKLRGRLKWRFGDPRTGPTCLGGVFDALASPGKLGRFPPFRVWDMAQCGFLFALPPILIDEDPWALSFSHNLCLLGSFLSNRVPSQPNAEHHSRRASQLFSSISTPGSPESPTPRPHWRPTTRPRK
jgi:hypothetical protein